MDTGFILNRRPFRDNSYLVDLFTRTSGRITCVARVAKKRGKIMSGTLEPFRQLRLDWIGRGEVQTLTMAEEQSRFHLSADILCKALYLNELLLKLIPKFAPAEETFVCYQQALYRLSEEVHALPALVLMECELHLLASLGYSLNVEGAHISNQLQYFYSPDAGICAAEPNAPNATNEHGYPGISADAVPISANLLIKLQESGTLDSLEQLELRHFLNQLIDVLLQGKRLKSRKLAFEYQDNF